MVIQSDLLMSKIYNYSNINITNSSKNQIHDLGIKAGDKCNNISVSHSSNSSDLNLGFSQLLINLNSIIKLYSECKLLQCYANRMTRSINNKLAKIDLKPFQNFAPAAQPKSSGK